jgi:hypothetical protein
MKRYNLINNVSTNMNEDIHGEWVKFTDIKNMIYSIEDVIRELQEFQPHPIIVSDNEVIVNYAIDILKNIINTNRCEQKNEST